MAKQPVPSDATIKEGENQVRDVLGAQIKGAKTAADRVKLAEQMRQTAAGTADPGAKCALLRDAEMLAAEAGDVDAVLAAHADLTSTFDLGSSRLATDIFVKLDRASLNPDAARKVCTAILSAAQDAVASDRYDVARQLTKLALPSARESNDRAMSEGISSLNSTISACEAEQKRIAPARAALATNPNDPAANAAVGRFYCLTKGDWAKGLPMLAKGNDAVLKPLAIKDLSQPSSPLEQAALADAWWAYADSQPQLVRGPVHLRAGYWYDQASAGLSGLVQLKANQRAADYRVAHQADLAKPQQQPLAGASSAPDMFSSALQIVQAVPQNLYPPTMAGWNDQRRTAVNDELETRVVGHSAVLQTVVQSLHHGNISIRLYGRPAKLGPFTCRIDVNLSPEYKDAAIQEGNSCLVTGQISICRFNGTELFITVADAQLTTPEQAAQAVRRANTPLPPGAAGGRSAYASLDQIVAAIPADLAPAASEDWKDPDKRQKFSAEYLKRFMLKTATFQIKIEKVNTIGPAMIYSSEKIPVGTLSLTMNVSFDAADPVAKGMNVGQTYTFSGKITGLGYGPTGINMSASKCKVVKSD